MASREIACASLRHLRRRDPCKPTSPSSIWWGIKRCISFLNLAEIGKVLHETRALRRVPDDEARQTAEYGGLLKDDIHL